MAKSIGTEICASGKPPEFIHYLSISTNYSIYSLYLKRWIGPPSEVPNDSSVFFFCFIYNEDEVGRHKEKMGWRETRVVQWTRTWFSIYDKGLFTLIFHCYTVYSQPKQTTNKHNHASFFIRRQMYNRFCFRSFFNEESQGCTLNCNFDTHFFQMICFRSQWIDIIRIPNLNSFPLFYLFVFFFGFLFIWFNVSFDINDEVFDAQYYSKENKKHSKLQ